MSAETIARWNAIPLNRAEPDQSAPPSLKRPRHEGDGEDDDSEDNISLVSRTPSPPPPDAMDVDKYDEYYANKPQREVVTVETKIKSSNVGFAMLSKMGWVEGSPLGLSGDGRVDPIPFYVKNDLTGLGKASQDVRMIETTVSQRRELDSERQVKETGEQRKQREDAVARRAAVKSEISNVLRPFYCEVCEKQFQNVAQYDEHTNSYAHHHKVRFRDMQAAQRASRNTEEEVNKRKEKERKREEKELRKIAKAAGIKMTKPPAPLAAATPTAESTGTGGGFKKGGWATVSTPSASSLIPQYPIGASNQSGWVTMGETQPSSGPSIGSRASVSDRAPPPPSEQAPNNVRSAYTSAPSFRTGGWTSLDTSSIPPPQVPPQHAPPPPPPVAVHPPSPPIATTFNVARQDIPSPSDAGGSSTPIPPTAVMTRPPPFSAKPPQEASRSGWQKFRADGPGRRR